MAIHGFGLNALIEVGRRHWPGAPAEEVQGPKEERRAREGTPGRGAVDRGRDEEPAGRERDKRVRGLGGREGALPDAERGAGLPEPAEPGIRRDGGRESVAMQEIED